EGAVEADDVVVRIAAGRGQEADPRPLRPGQPEHVVVEQGVAGLHRKAAAAEGDDLTRCRLHGEMFAASALAVVVQRSEVQPAALAPAYSRRSLLRARCRRTFTVPSGIPSRRAIVAWVRSSWYFISSSRRSRSFNPASAACRSASSTAARTRSSSAPSRNSIV